MPNNHHTLGQLQKNDLGYSVLTLELMQNNRRYGTWVDESHVRFSMRRKDAAEVGFSLEEDIRSLVLPLVHFVIYLIH